VRVQGLFEEGDARPPAARVAKTILLTAVVVSVVATSLETVEPLAAGYRVLFAAIELLTTSVFGVEYALRLWAAPEGAPDAGSPVQARLRYATSAAGIIDLLAILPVFASVLLPIHPDWLRVGRLLRLFKVGRYAPALPLFAAVIRNESRPLLAALMVMTVLLVLNSGIMFALERAAQPSVFASLPHTMWWTIVTMATVGYGDIVPMTAVGKMFAGVVMILGIAMFAVPAGILATGFAIELRRRDFVVTWQTVARVPLFAGLDAARIAEIARLLKREIVPAKYAVVRRGEPADAMFFIMAGEVEVDVQPSPRRMGRGQFFGEIALLRDTTRTATVTTITECELLVLDVGDFRRLLDAHPEIKASIRQVAEQRLADVGDPSAPPPPPA
jgi:voltage-gated potassium channel